MSSSMVALMWQWNHWYRQGSLKFVTKWAEAVQWNEIKESIDDRLIHNDLTTEPLSIIS